MAKSGKSKGSKSQDGSGKQSEASGAQYDGGVVVTGTIDGKIRDVEVGLITGDVTQTNSSAQSANNTSVGGGGGSQTNGQFVLQTNTVVAEGDADLDITIQGKFKGEIRDVEVGLITGDVTQSNTAWQAAGNLSVGGGGAGAQANTQIVEQINHVSAIGSVEVDMVFSGSFQGKVRDLEVGLITADVTQANHAVQGAANIAIGGSGGTQTIVQGAGQANVLAVVGDVDITLVFEGDFKGQVRDITIGVVTGDVNQTNTAVQVGMNVSAGRHSGSQSIEQFITQTNVVDANGDVDVVIRFDPAYKGDYRDIGISLMIDNVLQSNTAFQSASNVALDAVWH
ncbi:hypothetical protein GCM10009416_29830 [Craurococcus roseus]|uniref:Polymer-forming cytoskeletal protein n=1 Tax=Craurococcus roseus TaxID=77585 RepID=A0ABP3QHW3_9PROT